MYFRLLGTNRSHVKAKNERFTGVGSRCRQNLKYENFTSSFGRQQRDLASRLRPTPNGKRQAAACRKSKKINYLILAYFTVFVTYSIAVANRQNIS